MRERRRVRENRVEGFRTSLHCSRTLRSSPKYRIEPSFRVSRRVITPERERADRVSDLVRERVSVPRRELSDLWERETKKLKWILVTVKRERDFRTKFSRRTLQQQAASFTLSTTFQERKREKEASNNWRERERENEERNLITISFPNHCSKKNSKIYYSLHPLSLDLQQRDKNQSSRTSEELKKKSK